MSHFVGSALAKQQIGSCREGGAGSTWSRRVRVVPKATPPTRSRLPHRHFAPTPAPRDDTNSPFPGPRHRPNGTLRHLATLAALGASPTDPLVSEVSKSVGSAGPRHQRDEPICGFSPREAAGWLISPGHRGRWRGRDSLTDTSRRACVARGLKVTFQGVSEALKREFAPSREGVRVRRGAVG